MPRPVVRLLAIDIDGTLLDSRHQVPDAHRDALAAASAAGVGIVLATGRSFHFSRAIAEALAVPLTLIVNNGALVKDREGVTRLRHLLDRDVARAVLAGTRPFEDSVAVVFDRPEERQVLFDRMDWDHPKRRGYYERNKAFMARTGPLEDALTEDPVQLMFNGHVEPMRNLVAALGALPYASAFSIAVTEYESRDFSLVDVNGPGCSKGATLERWAGTLGIARGEVMAVGDNLNDAEMLDFAGTPVVMGNATDALKSRGWHLTGTNDDAGLAQAIERFILNPATRPHEGTT